MNWALWPEQLRGEIRENWDTVLSIKQRSNHGNPGFILTRRRDENVDIPHTCSPVFPNQSLRQKEQRKLRCHRVSSRAAVCIFHVKWKATKMLTRTWGIFPLQCLQSQNILVERKKGTEQTSKWNSKGVEIREASCSTCWEEKEISRRSQIVWDGATKDILNKTAEILKRLK